MSLVTQQLPVALRRDEPRGDRLTDSGAESSGKGPERSRKPVLFAALVYLATALVYTGRAWLNPSHRTVGLSGDPDKFMGFLGWYPFALSHGLNPLHLSWINLPTGSNAMWDTTMPLPATLISPITAAFGVTVAYNVLAVLALTSNGFCSFLWLRRHVAHDLSAFAGGLLMAIGPYGAARAYQHLNLMMFFAIPLIFMVLEDIVREPGIRRLRRGAMLGALAGAQLLCTEEVLALAAVALGIALLAAAVSQRSQISRVLPQLALAGAVALVSCLIVAGPALAYQFLAHGVIKIAIQPHNVYVTDLLNFFVPTSVTAVSPRTTAAYMWTGNWIEWNGYIGVPMILMGLYVAVRCWNSRWVRVVSVTTVGVAVLSLGPRLHINGTSSIRMPEWLLDQLPVLGNILPNRFSLLVEFGMAALLAVFLDRVLSQPRRARWAGVAAAAIVGFSLLPTMSLPAATRDIPPFFRPGGDAQRLPFAAPVLVLPIPPEGASVAAVWQATAGFHFKLVSGASISVTSEGRSAYGSTLQPLRCVMDNAELPGSGGDCGLDPIPTARAQLVTLGVHAIVIGPMLGEAQAAAFITSLVGQQPVRDQGVLLWRF